MAKNDEDDVKESEEEVAAKAIEAAARKKKILMLAIVGVVLLLVAGGGTWFALGMLGGDKETAAEVSEGEHAPAEAAAGAGQHAHKEAFYQVLEPAFLANYQVGGKQRYLQLSLAVMARDEAALEAVKTHMPLLRNRIVMLLSGEVFEDLQTDAGRVQLQQKMLTAIQEILQKETGKPQIEQVFFTTFVMQ